MRRINEAGRRLIKEAEGLRLSAYLCPAGVWTVGWGSTREVYEGMEITEEEAEARLDADLSVFESGVEKCVGVPLTDNQFSALVSFAFNLGLGNLKSSTLLRKLNGRDYQGAADEFTRWDNAGGKALPGLTKRRQAERALFLHEDEVV